MASRLTSNERIGVLLTAILMLLAVIFMGVVRPRGGGAAEAVKTDTVILPAAAPEPSEVKPKRQTRKPAEATRKAPPERSYLDETF